MPADELTIESEHFLVDLAIVENAIEIARLDLRQCQNRIAKPLMKEIDAAPESERPAVTKALAERLANLRRTTFRSELATLAAKLVTLERRRAVILQKLERFEQLGALPTPSAGLELRGTFSSAENYRRLDVVALDGGSFIARRDNPGPCPGDGWQLLVQRGKPGRDGKSRT